MALALGLLLALVVFAFLFWSLRSPRGVAGERFAHDFALLKAEQASLEAQIEGGNMPEAEAKSLRNELRRRVLHLSRLSQGTAQLKDAPVPLAIGLLALVLAIFAALYALQVKDIEAVDVDGSIKPAPLRGELPQAASFDTLMAEGQARYAAGNPAGAFDAYEAASNVSPERVEGWLAQGEALVAASEGEVTPAAMLAFAQAERLSPDNPVSLYYSGLERLQQGDAAAAQAIWQSLQARSRQSAPWMPQLERGLAAAAQALGETPQPQIGLAEIEGMVAGLAAKLDVEPDDPQGWLMLARSYLVLEQPGKAAAALSQLEALSDVPDTLAQQARALRERLTIK